MKAFRRSSVPCVAVLPLLLWVGHQGDAVSLHVDAAHPAGPISPYIYGSNENRWEGDGRYLTFGRQGGNRMTAYNWENNASNAGNDYLNQSDDYLGGGDTPGEVPRKAVAAALSAHAAYLVTVPMAGYVAADKNAGGDVNKTPNYLQVRFRKSVARKGAPFAYPPDLRDDTVYQDEFVWWLERQFPNRPAGAAIWYSLDNEPDLWSATHSRIHPDKLTYKELLDKTIAYASAIKAVAPKTLIFGPASYGWNGYRTLQDAPDAGGRDFLDFYLAGMKQAEQQSGKRLLDVLDLHWYPEAQGGGKRITEADASPEVAKARMQATRSLWDPTYVEKSWIAQSLGNKPIALLPRIKEKIARNYPGTKLAFTEYTYGGAADISGAIAETDALGIFGREGVFAAAYWPVQGDSSFVHAAFDVYRDYDGQGASFGDVALPAESSAPAEVSVYASKFAHRDGLVFVVVNQSDQARPAVLDIDGASGALGRQFTLTREKATLQPNVFARRQGRHIAMTLAPLSVNVLEVK